jgi:hypothetical protein
MLTIIKNITIILFICSNLILCQNLRLKVELEKTDYLTGETILAIITVTNASNEKIRLSHFNYQDAVEYTKFYLYNENNDFVPPLFPIAELEADGPCNYYLKPEESISQIVNISTLFGNKEELNSNFAKFFNEPFSHGLLKSGKYRFKFEYRNIENTETLESPVIQFEVKSTNSSEDLLILEEIINNSVSMEKLDPKSRINKFEEIIDNNKMVNSVYLLNVYQALLSYCINFSNEDEYKIKLNNRYVELLQKFPNSMTSICFLLASNIDREIILKDPRLKDIILNNKSFNKVNNLFKIANIIIE